MSEQGGARHCGSGEQGAASWAGSERQNQSGRQSSGRSCRRCHQDPLKDDRGSSDADALMLRAKEVPDPQFRRHDCDVSRHVHGGGPAAAEARVSEDDDLHQRSGQSRVEVGVGTDHLRPHQPED